MCSVSSYAALALRAMAFCEEKGEKQPWRLSPNVCVAPYYIYGKKEKRVSDIGERHHYRRGGRRKGVGEGQRHGCFRTLRSARRRGRPQNKKEKTQLLRGRGGAFREV